MTQPEADEIKMRIIGGSDRLISSGAEFQPGQVLGGRYQIMGRLGKGGMGVVYRVRQMFLNKEFALKTVEKHGMSDIAIRRFHQEARTASALAHPNIIAVHDFGLLDEQTPFYVMEIATGETLGERLKKAGCLKLDEAIPIFVQVCFGLAYAHQQGVVHRDIKPSNIMLMDGVSGAEGSVKIVDFGIAKLTQHDGGEIQALTRTGEVFGSPLYMSPEQCSGERVDHRADIYSLGCVLFEALTGTPPYVGENALATMMRHQQEPAPTLKEASLGTDFPQAIENLVASMLAKSPDSRFQNLGVVAHRLGAMQRGESTTTGSKPARIAVRQQVKTMSIRSSHFYALLFGVATLSAAVAGLLGYQFNNYQRRTPPPVVAVSKKGPLQEDSAFGLSPSLNKVIDKECDRVLSPEAIKKELATPTPDHRFTERNADLSDQMFKFISEASWIRGLELLGSHVNNASLGRLSKLTLLWIDVSATNFNDKGAKGLSLCPRLSFISANWTRISDEGISDLSRIKGLDRLEVSGTKITDKGLMRLVQCKKLSTLGLRKAKQITSEGLAALEPTRLRLINLESTPIDDRGVAHIAKIATLETVVLSDTKVTVNGLKELCKNKSIKMIEIGHCPNINSEDVRLLKSSFPLIRFDDAEHGDSDL